jgi:hypothetical protein
VSHLIAILQDLRFEHEKNRPNGKSKASQKR